MSLLAVDLGGTFLRTAVVHDNGALDRLTCLRVPTVFEGSSSADIWHEIVEKVAEAALSAPGRSVQRIAIAFPGPMRGMMPLSAPTLTGIARVPPDLVSRIERRSGKKVAIVNDVAAAAAYIASTTGDDSFLIVTVSSGIGSRVYHRNFSGASVAYGGEIGHVVVDTAPDAPLCDCGGRGHLGAISSGRAFERAARKLTGRESLTNERDLVPAIRAGEPWAVELLTRSVSPLARFAFGVVVAAGLERIYIMGGFAAALGRCYADAFLSALEGQADSRSLQVDVPALLRLLAPETEASLRGAALAT